jgi:uncharacterized Zn-finger protein
VIRYVKFLIVYVYVHVHWCFLSEKLNKKLSFIIQVCRSVNYYRIHRLSHLAEYWFQISKNTYLHANSFFLFNLQRYPCETCGKIFKDNSKLVLHRQVHSNKRPHECDVCGKTFKRATTVRVHKRTVHGSKVLK